MLVLYFLLLSLWHNPLYFLFVAPFVIYMADTKRMVDKIEEFRGTIYWRSRGSIKTGSHNYMRLAPRPEWLQAYSAHEIHYECKALTKRGEPCMNFAHEGSDFCGTHTAMMGD
jgi:hypothetical protein